MTKGKVAAIGTGIAGAATAALLLTAPLYGVYYVSPSGSATAPGGPLTPWSMSAANAKAPVNAVVRVAPGTYTVAPSRDSVLFAATGDYSKNPSLRARTVIDAPLVGRKGMRVQGMFLKRGLDFNGSSEGASVAFCEIADHIWYGGSQTAAARRTTVLRCSGSLRSLGGHCYGEDPNRGQRYARPDSNTIAYSNFTVTRNQGEERVMSRWGGVDRMRFNRDTLRLFQNDPTNTNADDFASFKALHCMFWRWDSCLVLFDDLHPNRNNSGAFLMIRDSSIAWRSTGTTWRTQRGKIWLSFNTAGGIYACDGCPLLATCSSKGHKFIGDTFDINGLGAQCGSKGMIFSGCKFPRPFDVSGATVLAAIP